MEKEGEQLSTSRIANITRQISSGLAEAHKLGFVHRDLKPGNVMITLFDDSEQIKVLDFGLVAIADEAESVTRLTKTGYTLGTPRYLAPEQSQSAEVTSSADLYSLGVILYEMIAGKPPFVGDMKTVIMQHLCESPPVLPAADGLEALAMSLLEKEPVHRLASAVEVVNILDELSGKIKGSDMFMSLRAVSDPRDSLAPRRNSSPGINTAIDGETLDKLATAETALKPQNSWAPQLPLTDPAATGPSIELISQFPKPTDDRVILHPKKITAVVALVLILSGISLYIMNELGMLREETVRNVRNPVHVKPVEPIDKKPTEQPNNLEAETEVPSAVAAPSSIPKKSRALACKNPVVASPKSAPIKSLDTKFTAQEIKSLENKLRETLRQHGLKGTDIKNLRDIEPFSKSWQRSKTEPAKAARSSYARLLQAIQNNQVSVSILQKRLKEVHASLVWAAEKLGASEAVAAFEEEYLEFDGQARGASDVILRQKIAIKILDLERRIEILIRAK